MAIIDLITAANADVPRDKLKPHNCHEAVLGWVLMGKYPSLRVGDALSHNHPKAWMTVRSLSERYGVRGPSGEKQLDLEWFGKTVYREGFGRVQPPFLAASFMLGDIVVFHHPRNPMHSMVIVEWEAAPLRFGARGFNNEKSVGGPYMEWDPVVHDLARAQNWNAQGEFVTPTGIEYEIHKATFAAVCNNIPDSLDFAVPH